MITGLRLTLVHDHAGLQAGTVVDVTTNAIVTDKLSMPHSPRWANGKLWVLNAGTGQLGWVDFKTKSFVPLAFLPGFPRGLSIIGNIASSGRLPDATRAPSRCASSPRRPVRA